VKRNGQWFIRGYSGTLIKQLVCFSHGHLMLNVLAGDFDVRGQGKPLQEAANSKPSVMLFRSCCKIR
jgi:hypothetical protein